MDFKIAVLMGNVQVILVMLVFVHSVLMIPMQPNVEGPHVSLIHNVHQILA